MIRSGDHALWDAALEDVRRNAIRPGELYAVGRLFEEQMRAAAEAIRIVGRGYQRAMREAAQSLEALRIGKPVVTTAPTRAQALGLSAREVADRLYPRPRSIDVSPQLPPVRARRGTLPPRP